MNLINIFKTDVGRVVLNENVKQLEKYALKLKQIEGRIKSNQGGFQSQDLPVVKETESLVMKITKAVNEYKDLFCIKRQLNLSNMWININSYKDGNILHNHPDSFISGVFYIKAFKNCGNIQFKQSSNIEYHIPENEIESHNPYNSCWWTLPVVTNTLFIFPSWLEHQVQPNLSKKDRISLSFNYT